MAAVLAGAAVAQAVRVAVGSRGGVFRAVGREIVRGLTSIGWPIRRWVRTCRGVSRGVGAGRVLALHAGRVGVRIVDPSPLTLARDEEQSGQGEKETAHKGTHESWAPWGK